VGRCGGAPQQADGHCGLAEQAVASLAKKTPDRFSRANKHCPRLTATGGATQTVLIRERCQRCSDSRVLHVLVVGVSGAENETTRIGLAELQNDVSGKLIVTPADAVLGQFFYAIAHEVGQAMFDLLNVPGFWHQEAAAARRGRFLGPRYFK